MVGRIEVRIRPPVAVRLEVEDTRPVRHVDVVDAVDEALALHVDRAVLELAEALEGVDRTGIPLLGDVPRVVEHLADCLRGQRFVSAVVVAREDDGRTGAEVLHPIDDEQHALLARLGRDVVRMRVREAEALAGLLVLQDEIRADARAGRPPALGRGHVGRLGEPKRPSLLSLEAILAVEDGRRLAAPAVRLAVIADELELRQLLAQVRRLVGTHLLHAEGVEIELLHERDHVRLAALPGVRSSLIAGRKPDVVGSDANRVCGTRSHAAGQRNGQQAGEERNPSHHMFSSPCLESGLSPRVFHASAVATRPFGVRSR